MTQYNSIENISNDVNFLQSVICHIDMSTKYLPNQLFCIKDTNVITVYMTRSFADFLDIEVKQSDHTKRSRGFNSRHRRWYY